MNAATSYRGREMSRKHSSRTLGNVREPMMPKLLVRRFIHQLGYDLHSLPVDRLTLRDLEFDLPVLIGNSNPTVLDVGANTGQSIDLFCRTLANPNIIAFEPNPSLAAELRKKYANWNVLVEARALGSCEGSSKFNVLESHDLSSILELQRNEQNPFFNHPVQQVINVPVTTVDSYTKLRSLAHIDLLKIDTQGFDLEVLRGAAEILRRRAVDTLLVEVNFISLYVGQCSFGEIERFLAEKGYGLLTFYEIHRPRACIGWATACFRPLAQ